LERDLVHSDPLFVEMRRRIDVSAVLPHHFVERRAEAVFGNSIWFARFGIGCWGHFCLTKAGPHRCLRSEAMRQIDEFLRCDHAMSTREVTLRFCGRS